MNILRGGIFGVDGKQYDNFNEAWDAFVGHRYQGKQMDAEVYHKERLAFLSGAICALNIEAGRINKLASSEISIQEQVTKALMLTLNEALNLASEEFKRKI